MKTEIISFDKNNIDEQIETIHQFYKDGKVVAIPTETVYGLSADATDESAVLKIFQAKGRPSDNPLIVHFYQLEQLENLVDFDNEMVKKLADKFWPGPMTLILNLKANHQIANSVRAGLSTLAVRMPSNPIARKILEKTQLLLAAPSANTSGKPSPTRFEHVYYDMNHKIDAIVKGDIADLGLESTVIDCTKEKFLIARPGTISLDDIASVIGYEYIDYAVIKSDEKPISPGMKYRHYSPNADLFILDESLEDIIKKLETEEPSVAFISYKAYEDKLSTLNIKIKYLADNKENIEQSNKNLYNILRECDMEKVSKIFIQKIDEQDRAKALINRLTKAASKI